MSEPNRYRIADNRVQRLYGGNCLVVDPEGFLVEYSDYEKLKAENESLRKAGDVMARIIAPPTHGGGEWDGEWDAWQDAKQTPPQSPQP